MTDFGSHLVFSFCGDFKCPYSIQLPIWTKALGVFLEKISAKTKGKILNRSLDVKDFDISFAKGLSLEDGAATLTEYTSKIIVDEELFYLLDGKNVLISGGGRKNKFLIKRIEANSNYQISLKLIRNSNCFVKIMFSCQFS